MLEKNAFKEVIRNVPLVSIDLLLKNEREEILLGYRVNKPAQGFWFLPGGRIMKNETMAGAYQRISKAELGKELDFKSADLIGVFEHIYPDNVFGDETFGTHYVSIGYSSSFSCTIQDLPKSQHTDYSWWSIPQLLDSNVVHENTKRFFR